MQVASGDTVLIASFLYISLDLLSEWDSFDQCAHPAYKWLLSSYSLVIVSRLIHTCGTVLANSTGQQHFLVHWRVKGAGNTAMRLMTWLAFLPAFASWTVVGTFRLYELFKSPQCVPDPMHLWFFGIWQFLSYAWVVTYVVLGCMAWRYEKILRGAEGDFRQVADEEGIARWGGGGSRGGDRSDAGLDSLAMLSTSGRGLAPDAIQALPGRFSLGGEEGGCAADDCPICLCSLLPGEPLRRLSGCGHVFHRSCVDIWLLRAKECPLCKTDVVAPAL